MIGIINKEWVRGDTARFKIGVVGLDLSDAAVKIQLRRVAGGAVVLDSTAKGTVTKSYDGDQTLIEWVVAATDVATLEGQYKYDLQTTLAGEVVTWVGGTITIIEDITQ